MGHPIEWHFIGHLQTNKAKYAVKLFDMIHSIDRIELAQELDKRSGNFGKISKILIEVNVSGEPSKSGVALDQASTYYRRQQIPEFIHSGVDDHATLVR